MPAPPTENVDYTVAVRTLCEFAAKTGDLEVRFTPSPTAQQGIAGHLLVGARRGPGYEREVALEGRSGPLRVRGRADGYDPERRRLEEFKTHRGDLARMPANQRAHHWAQLKVYGALLCRQRGLDHIELALVYFDIKTELETALEEHWSASDLELHFRMLCDSFLVWAVQELAHRARRNAALAQLRFPQDTFRHGQRQLAEAVYRAACAERTLLAQAPTGIGKTLGVLYPLLKAAPGRKLDKILFLVAKTSGRGVALGALQSLQTGEPGALRVLEMAAKAMACEYPGRECSGAACPLARGFYDRLPAARAAALEVPCLDRETTRRVALGAEVCPYYLTQELARWCDVLVGDYHYFFDSSALLFALAAQNSWRVGLLVDEAHNLVARARDMYSAVLEPDMLEAAACVASGQARAALRVVRREWAASFHADGYAVQSFIPPSFVATLQHAASAIADDFVQPLAVVPEAVMTCYFSMQRFCRLAESFGRHSLFDTTAANERSGTTGRIGARPAGAVAAALCIRNVNPAPFLAARFAACSTAVLFSATLSPDDFYRRLLGLPASTQWLNVPSPFAADQLEVRIERAISTRYADRQRSLVPMADLMGARLEETPGNYLAFFSSFDYLQAALREFRQRFPHVDAWEQTRAMTGDEAQSFLDRFSPLGCGIGFAVLGGRFGEGIDLPGKRLVGVFIATLGLPQWNPVNTAMERRMHALFDAGYEFTYLYPGLQKVVQAAGRVIRTLTDRGCVYLMDDRYAAAPVRRLLPAWWRVQYG